MKSEKTQTVKYPELTVCLVGEDGNAYAIMGRVGSKLRIHLREEGKTKKEIDEIVEQYYSESMSGDYDNLLRVAMSYVNVI